MRIGVDLITATSLQGTEIFALNILHALVLEHRDIQLVLFVRAEFKKHIPQEISTAKQVRVVTLPSFAGQLGVAFLQQLVPPFLAVRYRCNKLWSPSPFASWWGIVPTAVTIHDAAYSRYPEFRNPLSKI